MARYAVGTFLIGVSMVLAAAFVAQVPAQARGGGFATENPTAAEHLDALPPDIRRSISQTRSCGGAASAGHYFSVSIDASGRRFIALHFENFQCPGSRPLCDATGCPHDIFVEMRGGYKRVFSIRAADVTMTNAGGVAGLDIIRGGSTTSLIWNGRQFVPRKGSRL